MRIIIDIDGEDVTVRTERTGKPSGDRADDTPPPEILRAAATLGAVSAGPAPREADLARMTTELSPAAAKALEGRSGDAGAAPFPPPGRRVRGDGEEPGEARENS